MATKTARITFLGTPDFKDFLTQEAKKEGISLSQLIRQRCMKSQVTDPDAELLTSLVGELQTATRKARRSLEQGLIDAEQVLAELRSRS
jgi:hypothetical protein